MKRIILFFSILFSLQAVAQNVYLRANAPTTVAVGEEFPLTFDINTDAKDLRINDIPDFNVLMGPNVAKSNEINISGNGMQRSVLTSISYVLQAPKEGVFSIPAASVMGNGKKYVSRPLKITVVSNPQNGGQSSPTQSSIQTIGGVEIFIRAIPSKTTVYEQEPVLLTYKLYMRGVVQIYEIGQNKYPEAKDFLTQEIPLPNNKQYSEETYNGKTYSTVVLEQKLLYPQRSGKLKIDEGEYTTLMKVVSKTPKHLFSEFFSNYQDVTRKVVAPAVNINVKELPANKPKSYANAVGNFTVKSTISDTEVKENEPVTFSVSISGIGNLHLIQNPNIEFLKNFEAYTPKINTDFQNTTNGITGTKTIDYLLIPRNTTGIFSIPAVEFSYFDLASQTYKTLHTNAHNITVTKSDGASAGSMQSFVKNEEQSSDIHFTPKTIFTIVSVVVFLLLAIILFLIFRKVNFKKTTTIKRENAYKKAIKRLQTVREFNEKSKFYDEILKILWEYLGDKLNIPVADLTKENIETGLLSVGANEMLIADLKKILSDCEYASYAPSSQMGEMNELYEKTVEKINQLEQQFKNKSI